MLALPLATLLSAVTITSMVVVAPPDTARVLGFSDDGTEAVIEERLTTDAGEQLLQYVVIGAHGAQLTAVASRNVGIGNMRVERVEREACRRDADALEDAVKQRFRALRVDSSGCASLGHQRSLVVIERSTPAPLMIGDKELTRLQARFRVAGDTFVSESGPLVLILRRDGGGVLEVRTFMRDDPRIHKRWSDPD